MKIRHLHLPSGTSEGIPILIDEHWSLAQAVAVSELLDDLREQIWRHYGPQLSEYYSKDRITPKPGAADGAESAIDGDPF